MNSGKENCICSEIVWGAFHHTIFFYFFFFQISLYESLLWWSCSSYILCFGVVVLWASVSPFLTPKRERARMAIQCYWFYCCACMLRDTDSSFLLVDTTCPVPLPLQDFVIWQQKRTTSNIACMKVQLLWWDQHSRMWLLLTLFFNIKKGSVWGCLVIHLVRPEFRFFVFHLNWTRV